MALPVVDTNQPEVKELIASSVKEIANTIFATASVSITAAAKAVTPSIPEMVADITEDLRAGPVDRFSKGLEKLDKLLQNFGGDIKDYSKELANFVNQREARINKSEKTIRELRENNVKAEIDSMGDIQILSKFEIGEREKLLKQTKTEIKELKEKISTNQKLVQEEKGDTKERRETILKSQNTLIEKEKDRTKLLETLNRTEEDDRKGFFQKLGDGIKEYVPEGLSEVGAAFTEGLMMPINVIKDLGIMFASLLKPLKFLLTPLKAMGKAFKKLGILLFGFIKKAALLFKGFIVGMMGAIASMLPFIAIGLAVVLAIGLVIAGLVKLLSVIEDNKESLLAFRDKIMAIPGEIADFFKGIFVKIKNFFIDAINSVIELINKFKPGKDIELLENVPMPGESPAEIVQAEGSPTIAAAQSGTGGATTNGLPVLDTNNGQSNTNNAAAVINNNAVNNNTTLGSFASSKNDDRSRMSLYSDVSP